MQQATALSPANAWSPRRVRVLNMTRLLSTKQKNKLHVAARSSSNSEYVDRRMDVPDDKVPWTVKWELYAPADWDHLTVLQNSRDKPKETSQQWADPREITEELRAELEERITYSPGGTATKMGGCIQFNEHGRPLNPQGRTGLCGRGLLGKWGPNYAADPIVTRFSPFSNVLQVLCILRKDTDVWALPGGMVMSGESVPDVVKKSLQQCGNFKGARLGSNVDLQKKKEHFDQLVRDLFSKGETVFMVRHSALLPRTSPAATARPCHCARRVILMTHATRTMRGWRARWCIVIVLRSSAPC